MSSGQTYVNLQPGDAAPWFRQRTTVNPDFAFDTAGGRYVVLCFFGTAGDPAGRRAVEAALSRRDLFDDTHAALFGVSYDPADERRLSEVAPGFRVFWDFDGAVGRLYGALPRDFTPGSEVRARRFWMVLDPTLRVTAVFPFGDGPQATQAVIDCIAALPPPERHLGFEAPAPILVIPHVFEPELCHALVGLYERHGGEESGFMKEVDGKTIAALNPRHKRRRDHAIEDEAAIRACRARIERRVVPELRKIFHFEATRMERYIVGCYDAADGAHFAPHRDNRTKGTAHRRFAVSINLNADFEGGEISFPEYGPRRYKAAPGAAIVFPCALLHTVSLVTRGRRYAFLPFLYDESGAEIREANKGFLNLEEPARQEQPAGAPA